MNSLQQVINCLKNNLHLSLDVRPESEFDEEYLTLWLYMANKKNSKENIEIEISRDDYEAFKEVLI